jgi:hypothetical protein
MARDRGSPWGFAASVAWVLRIAGVAIDAGLAAAAATLRSLGYYRDVDDAQLQGVIGVAQAHRQAGISLLEGDARRTLGTVEHAEGLERTAAVVTFVYEAQVRLLSGEVVTMNRNVKREFPANARVGDIRRVMDALAPAAFGPKQTSGELIGVPEVVNAGPLS